MLDIGQSDVHLWYLCTEDLLEDTIITTDRTLSAEERARRDRFHFPSDRRDFAAAHDLLRRTLSIYRDVSPADWRFKTNEYGKPSIDSVDPHLTSLSFSLTHTSGCVACGVTLRSAVGVDVERADRSQATMEIASRYFSLGEVDSLRKHSYETSRIKFTELWTLKEAYLKAIGVGLSGSLSSATFEFEEPNKIVFDCNGCGRVGWYFALFDLDAVTRLAVAARSDVRPDFTIFQGEDQTTHRQPHSVAFNRRLSQPG